MDAVECTTFRNESGARSSDMIKSAIQATISEWGALPKDGLITYVAADKIQSVNPGYYFKMAGFKIVGKSKKRGLIRLQYKLLGGEILKWYHKALYRLANSISSILAEEIRRQLTDTGSSHCSEE
jgi:hypothetical protein